MLASLDSGALTLSDLSVLDFDFDAPGVSTASPGSSDMVNVAGNLVMDGILQITDAGSFGQGVYKLFSYTGGLTDSGLVLPSSGIYTYSLDTSETGSVYLNVSAVPEPTSLAMLGLFGLPMLTRRRRA
jgi:hypothetical protein